MLVEVKVLRRVAGWYLVGRGKQEGSDGEGLTGVGRVMSSIREGSASLDSPRG